MPLPTTNNVQLDGATFAGAGSVFILPPGGDDDWIAYSEVDRLASAVGNSGKMIVSVDPAAKMREATLTYYPEEIGHKLLTAAFALQEAQQGPLATIPFPGWAWTHRRFSTGQVISGVMFIAGQAAPGSRKTPGTISWKLFVGEVVISPALAVTP